MTRLNRRAIRPAERTVMEPTIRRATTTDAAIIRALVRSAYEPYLRVMPVVPAPMLADYDEIASSGDAWVAARDNEIVGLLVLRMLRDHVLVENLAVAPGSQALGIGTRLLDFAEQTAREAHLGRLRLYTNEAMSDNLEYYPKRGYVEVHRATEDGYRRVFFEKVLD
jgi:N-acetylglutamate synthase-like GNAT family acetyltransferase